MSIDALHDLAANTGSNTSAPTSSTVSTLTNMPRAWPLGSPVSARRGGRAHYWNTLMGISQFGTAQGRSRVGGHARLPI